MTPISNRSDSPTPGSTTSGFKQSSLDLMVPLEHEEGVTCPCPSLQLFGLLPISDLCTRHRKARSLVLLWTVGGYGSSGGVQHLLLSWQDAAYRERRDNSVRRARPAFPGAGGAAWGCAGRGPQASPYGRGFAGESAKGVPGCSRDTLLWSYVM